MAPMPATSQLPVEIPIMTKAAPAPSRSIRSNGVSDTFTSRSFASASNSERYPASFCAPVIRPTSFPFRSVTTVGIPKTRNCSRISRELSALTGKKITLSPYSIASLSRIGFALMQGTHQDAQKSTMTGLSDSDIFCWNSDLFMGYEGERMEAHPLLILCYFLYVLNWKGAYKGQNATKAVRRKIAPSTTSTMPSVPVTIPPK